MNYVVVDTNIVFSAMRSHSSKVRDILYDTSIQFLTPNFLIAEIFKHKERILKNSKIDEIESYEILVKILDKLQFISESNISTNNFVNAFQLCKGIDENDIPFVALALEFDCLYWTRDQILRNGLLDRGFNRFFEES